jgi:predicted RNA-binding Zn ribbon-like protein
VQTPGFEWVGGELCLDFNNTVSWRDGRLTDERLRTPEDLVGWARTAGLPLEVTSRPARGLDLTTAHAIRKALHRVLSPLSRWRAPTPEDLASFNAYLERALTGTRISRGKGTFLWDFGVSALHPILSRTIWSAAALLTSGELRQLRECANPQCGWLFVDRSRRKNRRWCEMKECGNRAKARRYYSRHRSKRGKAPPRAPLGRESPR